MTAAMGLPYLGIAAPVGIGKAAVASALFAGRRDGIVPRENLLPGRRLHVGAVTAELPTVAQTLPGFDATTWHGLVAPAGTPPDVIETLHRATVAALKDVETRKHLVDLGVEIAGYSPEEFAAYIRREIPKWTAVVKVSGARLE